MEPIRTPSVLVDINPLLDTDLSKEISHLQRQYVKNEILLIISYVAFLAIASVAIWYSAFFALSNLPLVLVGITVTLQVIHSVFAHPCKLAADKYKKALSLERKIAKYMLFRGWDQIKARYEVLRKESSRTLNEVRKACNPEPEYTKKGHQPKNYRAFKLGHKAGNLTHQQETLYRSHLVAHKADKMVRQDDYLEKRVEQIFLAYVHRKNLYRSGAFKLVGHFQRNLVYRKLSGDDAFFTFNPTTFHIRRSDLMKAHKQAALSLIQGKRPEGVFTDHEWKEARRIAAKTPEKRAYLHEPLIPYIEMIVNEQFIPDFEKYDPNSFRAILSRALLGKDASKDFTREEIREAKQIAGTIEGPNREVQFRENPRIREIVEAKIKASLISSS